VLSTPPCQRPPPPPPRLSARRASRTSPPWSSTPATLRPATPASGWRTLRTPWRWSGAAGRCRRRASGPWCTSRCAWLPPAGWGGVAWQVRQRLVAPLLCSHPAGSGEEGRRLLGRCERPILTPGSSKSRAIGSTRVGACWEPSRGAGALSAGPLRAGLHLRQLGPLHERGVRLAGARAWPVPRQQHGARGHLAAAGRHQGQDGGLLHRRLARAGGYQVCVWGGGGVRYRPGAAGFEQHRGLGVWWLECSAWQGLVGWTGGLWSRSPVCVVTAVPVAEPL
jgi:hypothetical protein